jgi:hypothetical protein
VVRLADTVERTWQEEEAMALAFAAA